MDPSPSANSTTRAFLNCLGVFEGGGVRGAALAGAYDAAFRRGVRFGAVAGTSAGSLVAALIAAGAGPDFIKRKLLEKSFSELLTECRGIPTVFTDPLGWMAAAAGGMNARVRWLAKASRYSGRYEPTVIGDWVESLLRELLSKDQTVTFEHLPLPLYVVATDVIGQKPRVWGPSDKNDSVSYAVQCSCSIPFFFKANREKDAMYVDGSVLANLPSYVFQLPEVQDEVRSSLSRILAFRLVSDRGSGPVRAQVPNALALAEALLDTVVSGATDVQLALQTDIQTVNIPTGDVRSTDFAGMTPKKATELYQRGSDAVHEFLNHEFHHLRPQGRREYRGHEEFFMLIASSIAARRRHIVIAWKNANFALNLAPLMLFAQEDDVHIRVIVPRVSTASDGYAREWLRSMGVVVEEVDSLPWTGALIAKQDRIPNVGVVLQVIHEPEYGSAFENTPVMVYHDERDRAAIKGLADALTHSRVASGITTGLFDNVLPSTMSILAGKGRRFATIGVSAIESRLKTIDAYRNAHFHVDSVPIGRISALDRYVKEYRLVSVPRLIDALREQKIDLYDPCEAYLDGGRRTIVTPPIFEKHNDVFIAVEGVTRCFIGKSNGDSSIRGIVVENADPELPGKPIELRHVRATSRTMPVNRNFDSYRPEHMRRIEAAIHPVDSIVVR